MSVPVRHGERPNLVKTTKWDVQFVCPTVPKEDALRAEGAFAAVPLSFQILAVLSLCPMLWIKQSDLPFGDVI